MGQKVTVPPPTKAQLSTAALDPNRKRERDAQRRHRMPLSGIDRRLGDIGNRQIGQILLTNSQP